MRPLGEACTNSARRTTRTYYVPPTSIDYVWHYRWVPGWVDDFRAVNWPSLNRIANKQLNRRLRECVRNETWYINATKSEEEVLLFLFDLHRLAQSIRRCGLLNPLTLNPIPGKDRYELIAGQRRLLASVYAGEESVRATVYTKRVEWADFLRIQQEENWDWEIT